MPGPLNQPGHFRQETNGEVEIVFKQENTPEPEHPLPSGVDPSMVPHPNMFDMFHEVDDAKTADEFPELTPEEEAAKAEADTDLSKTEEMRKDNTQARAAMPEGEGIKSETPDVIDQPPQGDDDETTVVTGGEAARIPDSVPDPGTDAAGEGPHDRPESG